MMRLFFISFFFITVFNGFSQDLEVAKDSTKVKIDSLYREDQFYFGFAFNSLKNKPANLSQSKLSTGVTMGFLRDMPINSSRTIAIATGIGVTYNNYNQNLEISNPDQKLVYQIIDPDHYFKKNKFSQLLIDLPIEFRWRTSTPESYKFWRIYGGVKFSYLAYNRSIYKDDITTIKITKNNDFNNFLYGVYLSTGFNTWNVYAYYSLNPIFKTAQINNELIKMNALNIGLIFYIL